MKLNIKNEMKLSFAAHAVNEGFARGVVAIFISQIDPPVDKLAEVKTAVSEAVTNAVVHGYRGQELSECRIDISVKITDGEQNKVIIKIRDYGCGITDIRQAMEPMFTTAPHEERAGLGFAVMESFCDKIKVHSQPGRGTIVTLTKTF